MLLRIESPDFNLEIAFDRIEIIPNEYALKLYSEKDDTYLPPIRVSVTQLSEFGKELFKNKAR